MKLNEPQSTQIDTPTVRNAVKLIARVYDFNGVGGCLHVQIDDNNLSDEYFADELLHHFVAHPADESDEQAAEDACYTALRALSHSERVSAVALYDARSAGVTPV